MALLDDAQSRLAARPRDPLLHFEVAQAQMALGRVASAAASLRKSLDLEPSPMVLSAYHAVGDALMQSSQFADAEACWRRLIEIEPGDLAVRERLAATLRLSGRLQEAADMWHGIMPELHGAPEDQAWLYLDLGATIDQLLPAAGTGAEWILSQTQEEPRTLLVGEGSNAEELSAEDCYRP